MREDTQSIADRLTQLQVPPSLISDHLRSLEKWRRSNPVKVKRRKLYDYVLNASGRQVVFVPKKPRRRIK